MAIKFSFPLGSYFRQLFAADTYVRFINPLEFWRRHQIKHLNNCSKLDSVEHLKRCYRKQHNLQKFVEHRIDYSDKVVIANNNFRITLYNALFCYSTQQKTLLSWCQIGKNPYCHNLF